MLPSEDDIIQDFLWVDSCAKLADKVSVLLEYIRVQYSIQFNMIKDTPCILSLSVQYLVAMVYVYFRRACLSIEDYNRTNFFIAL